MDIRAKKDQAIIIGRIGENERIRVIFDVDDLIGELGTDISFTLLHQKPGEDTAYPVPTAAFDGDELIWTVTAADTSAQGRGRCELICTVGDVVAKTVIWSTVIQTALDGSGEVPDVWESWQEVFADLKSGAEAARDAAGAAAEAADLASDVAQKAANDAMNYASSAYHDKEAAATSASVASTYADAAQSSADDAAEWRDSAEMAADAAEAARDAADTAAADAAESAEKIIGLTATAETLPEGSTATASYDSTSGTLTLGIPTGATGPQGIQGETGPRGIQGETGPAGTAGYSPSASVTQTSDGAVIEITDATGTTSATLSDSKIWDNLDAETDSYTPQVVIPCDDSGTVLSGAVTKRGRMLYINGVIPSNLRICIYGAFKGTRSVPSYVAFPEWYGEPFDGFVVGHTYRYVPEIISGTVEATGGNDLLVLRQKDDTYKSISAGSTAVCEVLPEAVFVMLRTGTYTNVKLYLHIVDVTASPVTDVQVNGSSVVDAGVANVPIASANTPGVVKIGTGLAVNSSDVLYVRTPTDANVKAGTSAQHSITPEKQHAATFYGLAKAAGDTSQSASENAVGTYTDEAKVAIQKMLGIYEAPWELIREDTATNATEADIIINADSNGQAFELSDVRLVLVSPQQDTAFSKADYGRVRSYYQTGAYDIIFIGAYTQAAGATAKVSYIAFEQSDGMLVKSVMPSTSRGGMGPLQTYATEDGEGHFVLTDMPRVYSKINITKVTGTLHYILYGKRKVV